MVTEIKDIKATRGDSIGFYFQIENFEDDLDGASFSVKENPDSNDYIFQKTIGSGITKMEDGYYYVKAEPEDTKDLEASEYHYDLEIKVGADVYTLLKGKLILLWDITKGGNSNE